MYQNFACYSSPVGSGDEGSSGLRREEVPVRLRKYKALQKSVCFLCLLSLRSDGGKRRPGASPSKDSIEVIHDGHIVTVRRAIDLDRVLREKLPAATHRCPPACVGPVQKALGVSVVDELDLLAFMECELALGHGVLIDTRTPDLHKRDTIPGSINIPYTVLHLDHAAPRLVQALRLLAVKPKMGKNGKLGASDGMPSTTQALLNDIWDFSSAKEIVLWCNGPAGQQSPMAIDGLKKLGYPKEKIHHYRGGMQLWRAFDLTTVGSGK